MVSSTSLRLARRLAGLLPGSAQARGLLGAAASGMSQLPWHGQQQTQRWQPWQLQLQQHAVASAAATANNRTNREADASDQAPPSPQPRPASSDRSAAHQKQQQSARNPSPLAGLSFEELSADVAAALAQKNPQREATLLALIGKAQSGEQVEAALRAVRTNRARRCRLGHTQHMSSAVFSNLLKAGQRAGLGHAFGVQLLQQADELGLATSARLCEGVVQACIKARDWPAASIAWLYSQLYCTDALRQQQQQQEQQEQHNEQEQQQQEQQAAGSRRPGAWASKSLLRLYSAGMAHWLAQGGLNPGHEVVLRRELAGLAEELASRGAQASAVVSQALAVPPSASRAAAGGAGTAEAAGEAGEAEAAAEAAGAVAGADKEAEA